jgi:hypothetical protein
MAQLLVRHRVADFNRWKAVSDGRAAGQSVLDRPDIYYLTVA